MKTKRQIPRTKKVIIIGASIAVLITLGIVGFLVLNPGHSPADLTTNTDTQSVNTLTPQPTRLHVAAMGDMLAHDSVIANAKTSKGYDFGRYFGRIRSLYSNADIVFCNQEGPSAGAAYGISGYPSFNAPTQFAEGLQSGAGCNVINLANNHMGDKGVAVTNETVDLWDGLNPLAFAGANRSAAEQNTVRYTTVKGVKISFLAFADFNNNRATPAYSVNSYHDQALVKKLVKEARKKSDVVLVSMHWGTEDSEVINADQRQQVDLLASLGVDVIIGTGPHVLQPVDIIKRPDGQKMTVWYSLGNMLSTQLNIPQLFSGVASFDIVKHTDGTVAIEKLGFKPTYMHYEWTAAQEAQSDLLARKNVMIYPFSEATFPLEKTRLNTTIAEQWNYIVKTLGKDVTVE